MSKGYKPTPLADRFWPKVAKGPGCWEWTASVDGRGYGQIKIGSAADNTHTMRRAHRVAWEFTNGPIPPGMELCHRCDNPRCVRPEHMFIGTHAENMADMVAKGRSRTGRRGAMNHKAKLSEDDVLDIRAIHAFGAQQKDIARAYGLDASSISEIVNARTWRHV